jgi:hypothetical protein
MAARSKGENKAKLPAGGGEEKARDPLPPDAELDFDPILELRAVSAAALALAEKPEAFDEAYKAFLANDAARFQAVLDRLGLGDRCERICYFLCRKHCVAVCHRFCLDLPSEPANPQEWREFARVLAALAADEAALKRLLAIYRTEDVQAWREWIKEHKFERYCHQLCHFLGDLRCKMVCRDLCPPKPLITRVGSIPISQISPSGLGNGPSVPPFHVGAPNPPAGYGDHPFGGSVWLMGVFNFPTAQEYLVEVSSTGPGGSYSPVNVASVVGYNYISVFPYTMSVTRYPSTGVDPGWFKLSEIPDSDGGPGAAGEKTLLYWPTGGLPDGLYHLRLRVRDGATTRVSSPQPVYLDNSGPFPLPRPTIALELQRPDGTRAALKCGKVKKGDGLIVVRIHAYDPHYAGVAVTARGNSGLSVPVVDVTNTPLSKTYNGNLADQGYPVPTEFLWDPWSDPRVVPCCYVVYVEINDRAILNDSYAGGHANSGWEAIEIGF